MNDTLKTPAQLEDLYRQDPRKACQKALRLTRNLPWKDRLDAIDKLLGTFGTEAIRGEWQNGYWCDIVAAYCNTGDTYALTVLHVRGDGPWNEQGRFIVSSWGDWVERNSEKYSIQRWKVGARGEEEQPTRRGNGRVPLGDYSGPRDRFS